MERIPIGPSFDDGKVFRSVFAAYPDALLLVDQAGHVALANPAALDLLGYSGNELIGLSVDDLVPDSVRPRHAAYRHAYAQAPRTRPMGTQINLVAKRRDGSSVMVEIALSPLHDDGLPYVVAAIRDIGAYPRVKQALQRARYAEHLAQFGRLAVDTRDPHTLLPQVPAIAAQALEVETAMILMLEPGGTALRIAAACGLPVGSAVGDLLDNVDSLPSGRVVGTGQPLVVRDIEVEPSVRLPPGWQQAGIRSSVSVPLSDRGRTIGTLVACSEVAGRFGEDEERFLDSLSSLLATVLQRESSEEALSHSQRLESVGQLTGGIAHDFNNLLTVIAGNLQVLEEMPAHRGDPLFRQLTSAALRAARSGAELTGQLLAFSRRQVLQPTIVDTRALLDSLTDMLRRTLDQRIDIRLDADAVLCLADPVQLESTLLNIAINARDAMPDGGSLVFACRPVAALPPALAAMQDDAGAEGYVSIAVSDTGVGMSDAVKERAFEPFFTTKETGRGTGLGLSAVYGFARQSHGAVELASTPGMGTTITLYLPRVDEDLGLLEGDDDEGDAGASVHIAGAESREGDDLALLAGLRILVVEDDSEVRSVVQRFLLPSCGDLTLCASAAQALSALESDAPFDLLLSDIALGAGISGTALADAARALRPRLPILLMSGFARDLPEASTGWDLLRKPFSRAELERAVARAVL